MTTASTYDEVPYEGYPVPHSHPDRLKTIAKLFGLESPEVETARILELGCGTGANIIPMAEQFPGARFVGVDLSERQIADGTDVIEKVGLENIRLDHGSILNVDAKHGEFDYIICHGVYSWVPRDVQDHILKVCGENLSPNGVAYVSYNTYPGWHMRQMVR